MVSSNEALKRTKIVGADHVQGHLEAKRTKGETCSSQTHVLVLPRMWIMKQTLLYCIKKRRKIEYGCKWKKKEGNVRIGPRRNQIRPWTLKRFHVIKQRIMSKYYTHVKRHIPVWLMLILLFLIFFLQVFLFQFYWQLLEWSAVVNGDVRQRRTAQITALRWEKFVLPIKDWLMWRRALTIIR